MPPLAFDKTVPVGSFNANASDIRELEGNARQFSEDLFKPRSPDSHPVRGGDRLDNIERSLNSSIRFMMLAGARRENQGFRVVLESLAP